MWSCACGGPAIFVESANSNFVSLRRIQNDVVVIPYHGGNRRSMSFRVSGTRASMVDSYGSSSNFVERMEKAWLISQQPRPVACSSCNSQGHVECKWCRGTGFFIIGDNMLCEVPSRNTSCVICHGKGSMCCSDCKGTGFRAKWLGEPPIPK